MSAVSRILVATDFGAPSAAALRTGQEFARTFSAELHLVHVVGDVVERTTAAPPPSVDLAALQAEYDADAQRKLDALIDDSGQTPGAIAIVLRSNQTASAILEYAASHQIDLIVMGTHGRGGFMDFFMGSVAQQVVRTSPCPVLTLRALPSTAQHDGPA